MSFHQSERMKIVLTEMRIAGFGATRSLNFGLASVTRQTSFATRAHGKSHDAVVQPSFRFWNVKSHVRPLKRRRTLAYSVCGLATQRNTPGLGRGKASFTEEEGDMGKVLSAKNWIGGEWVDSSTRLNSINPATGEVIGTYADGSADEANRAIAIARKAFLASNTRQLFTRSTSTPRPKPTRRVESAFAEKSRAGGSTGWAFLGAILVRQETDKLMRSREISRKPARTGH
jgi:hypothetical protein